MESPFLRSTSSRSVTSAEGINDSIAIERRIAPLKRPHHVWDDAELCRFNVAMTSHFFRSVGSSRPPSRSACHSRRFPSPSSSKMSSNSNPCSTATVKKGANFRRPMIGDVLLGIFTDVG
ncbi:hypothetical protein KC325_g79 [Hortaea werneckii]|nr:hypothetical protein KC325_g79 [Hortaea werneckii]